MPKRAPLHMRDALATRNSADRWNGVKLNYLDKELIQYALNKLSAEYNDPGSKLAVARLIAKVNSLSI